MPSQSDRRDNTEVPEDIRLTPDRIMYDTLSEGKKNNNLWYVIREFKKNAPCMIRAYMIRVPAFSFFFRRDVCTKPYEKHVQ